MGSPLIFRSRLAQGLAILVAVVAIVAVVVFVAEEGAGALLTTAAPVALVIGLAWAVLWRPHAAVSDDGITLVNIVRTVRVPWRRFSSADTRWALSITTTEGSTYTSWAVPAGSGFGARLAPSSRQRGDWAPAQVKLGSTGTAEAAAVAIAERVRNRKDRGPAVESPLREVSVSVNANVLYVLAGLAALTAVSAVLG